MRTRRGQFRMLLVATIAALTLLSCREQPALPRQLPAPEGKFVDQHAVETTVPPFTGYTGKTSYFPGETIDFHVSSPNPGQYYKVFIFREGFARPLVHVQTSQLPATQNTDLLDAEYGYTWETTASVDGSITSGWPSGYYLARLEDVSVGSAQLVHPGEYIPFIVKPAVPSSGKILVQLPTNTWIAYDDRLGRSYYTAPRTFETSFHRPSRHYWAWTDGTNSLNVADVEGYYLRWLEQNGYQFDVVGNGDLADSSILNADDYRLFISVGHDEYWTHEQWATLNEFLADGGNVLMLSSGAIYYQARFEDSQRTLTCYKMDNFASLHDPLWGIDDQRVTTRWGLPPVNLPEAAVVGLSYLYGGNSAGVNATGGYQVYYTNDWAFANTGLHNGDVIGLYTSISDDILAQETDATYFQWSGGLPIVSDTELTHTPANFKILGVHPADSLPPAVMGYYTTPAGGIVFHTGTWDWWKGLFRNDTAIVQITQNVLAHLTQGPVNPSPIAQPQTSTLWLRDGENGYGGTSDTYLDASAANSNFGSAQTLNLSHNRTGPRQAVLVKFDVSALATADEVVSAQVVLYPINLRDGQELKVSLLMPSSPWTEEAATWNSPDGSASWPGDSATAGTSLDNEFIRVTNCAIAFEVTDQVRAWLANPSDNLGVAFRGYTHYDGNYEWTLVDFASSEYPDVSLRPALLVDYRCSLPADFDHNGMVDAVDIQFVAGHWNCAEGDPACTYELQCDMDRDADDDIVDIERVAMAWGARCPIANVAAR